MAVHREPPGREIRRRLAVGAEVLPEGGVHFRIWAPRRESVEVLYSGGSSSGRASAPDAHAWRSHPLEREEAGYFSGIVAHAAAGTFYRYRLDGGDSFPDPASRFQPEGPHGPSQVIDPASFRWADHDWRGVGLRGQVVYELHIGTFTPEGTWAAAARQLDALADLGVTVLEIMPVADFTGRFGWGYDGVNLFAPTRLYGAPDDFRGFVDRAHSLALGVILDVVYNHLGPDGNYLQQFSADYFTDRYENEWGEAINFDGPNAPPVREFFLANAAYWIDEFQLDGLRLDATQQIFDRSEPHILLQIGEHVRQGARARSTVIIAENEPQESRLVRPPERDGFGLDALWNDDFHHSAMVALTGRNEAYYSDHLGTPQELISAVKWGFLYQGQRYRWQNQRRGTAAFDLEPAAFVTFIQNHDQIANSGGGQRIHGLTSPGELRAITALLLLAPGTPMLFMGQEFAASAPFLYFADHEPELAAQVDRGRKEFLAQFPSLATGEIQRGLADPAAVTTFESCKLDHDERSRNTAVYALHRDLLRLRRDDPVFRLQRRHVVDGAVLSTGALLLRFFGDAGDDRLLLVNLGRDLTLEPAPEPLLAPPTGRYWGMLWSSEQARYGGTGATSPEAADGSWRIPGHAAVVLAPE